MDGRHVPKQGWGSLVQCEVRLKKDSKLHPSSIIVGQVNPRSSNYEFGRSLGDTVFYLLGDWISVQVRQGKFVRYTFRTQAVSPPKLAAPHELDQLRRLQAIYKSPKSLRDLMLADVATLRQRSRDEITRSINIQMTDASNARSDNPPRRREVMSVDKLIRGKLQQEANAELDRRESVIKEHYKAIHQSIVDALPIGHLLTQP